MNANLGKTEFTPEEIDALRDRLRDYKADHKLSWTDLAKVTGVAQGTLSAWVPGTYNQGKYYDHMDTPGRVHRFFASVEERASLESSLPAEPDFQMTDSAKRMMTCLALAQLGDMALIACPSGTGKTATLKQYAATRGQVTVVTAAPSNRGVSTLLIAILNAYGERDVKGTPQVLSNRIRARTRDSGSLLVIDEAQHLAAPALEELRSIHDDTECGIALVGDQNLTANLKSYPQLYSRLGVRYSQPRPTPADITTIAAAWGVNSGPELTYLHEIGRKGGGIRTVTKTLKLAARAARAGGAPMEVSDIRDAYAQRFGEAA